MFLEVPARSDYPVGLQEGNRVSEVTDKAFWRVAIVAFAVVATINYLPVLEGKIPFPRDLVLRHSAWAQRIGAAVPSPSPEISDLITSFYPFRSLAAQAASQHTLPLWNPFILAGSPLQANSQSAPFYPFNFLYAVLPLNLAWTLCMILRLLLAAVFMALLVRSIGGSATGAILSGIVFSLCGFMTAWQGTGMSDAAIWLPMICYAVLRLQRNRSTRSIALAGFSFAMPVLAGHPETAAHLTLIGCALALTLAWYRMKTIDLRFLVSFALAGILALGLASIQIIPTLEWFGQLGTFVEREPAALSRHDGQGFFSRDLQSSPNSSLLRIPEAAAYLGMLGVLAAPLAFFHRSRRFAAFFAGIAIVSAAIAFSIEPAHSIVAHLPLLKGLKNGRLILVASFGIAALAGLGVSALEQYADGFSFRKRTLAASLVGGALLFSIAGIYEVHRATFVPVDFMRGPWGTLTFLVPAAALLTFSVGGTIRGRLFSFLICGLAALELLTFSYGYASFSKPEDVFPTAPVFEFLRSRGNPATFRIAKSGYPIPANAGMIYGLESADGYEIPTERAKVFSAGLIEERGDSVFYEAKKVAPSPDRRMDMLNVRYWTVIAGSPDFAEFSKRPEKFALIFKEGSVAVFESKSALARLFAVPQTGIQVIPEATAQMARIKNSQFNPEETVLFSEPLPELSTERSGDSRFTCDIELIQREPNSYVFRTRSSSRSVLVLSQIYYPGWKATIDGNEVAVYPVDYALTGILAPEGEHAIRFFFQPGSFRIGAMLSLISLFAAAVLIRSGAVWKKGRYLKGSPDDPSCLYS